jgi:hypothetical protein
MKSANAYSESSDGDKRAIDEEEVLGFQANLLLDLPLYTSLTLRVPGFSEEVVWTTRVLETPRQPSEQIWFDKEEMRALISASESERAWPNDFKEWCWMKRESPDFILNPEITLSGAQPTTDRNWDVGKVLKWLELDFVSVHVSHPIEKEDGSVAKAA